jgi:hypothetical protein
MDYPLKSPICGFFPLKHLQKYVFYLKKPQKNQRKMNKNKI